MERNQPCDLQACQWRESLRAPALARAHLRLRILHAAAELHLARSLDAAQGLLPPGLALLDLHPQPCSGLPYPEVRKLRA